MDPFNMKTSHGTQLVSRRDVLRGAAFSVGALASRAAWTPKAAGIDPPARFKPGKLRLSMAAYSVRDLLQQPDSGWDLFRFVDYCLELGLEGAELTSYYFPETVDEAYSARLRMHCHRRRIRC